MGFIGFTGFIRFIGFITLLVFRGSTMKIGKITDIYLLSPHRLTPSLIWLVKLLTLAFWKGPPIPMHGSRQSTLKAMHHRCSVS